MLLNYNMSVGLADAQGNIVERTASEMKVLESDASSRLFIREQNRNDNKDPNKKFVQIYGDEVKNGCAFYQLAKKQTDPLHSENDGSDP